MMPPSLRRQSLLPLLITTLLLVTGCAVPASLTLTPAAMAPPPGAAEASATVLLHPFSEAFDPAAVIGSHRHTRDQETQLRIVQGTASRALDGLLLNALAQRHIATATDGKGWDLTPEGLAAFHEPARLVLTGRITGLRIKADETVATGKARAEMEVECVLGLVREQKVLRRRVHVAQEMVTFTIDQKKLEQLLNDCLSAASKEILAQCKDLVAGVGAPPQASGANDSRQPRSVSLSHEPTGQTG